MRTPRRSWAPARVDVVHAAQSFVPISYGDARVLEDLGGFEKGAVEDMGYDGMIDHDLDEA